MTRGRPPSRGMDAALPIAKARGRVLEFVQNGETPAEFEIVGDGKIIFVRIRRADPFRRTPEELDAENRELLAQIRSIPANVNIHREFWAYSKYGTLRFFRVEDTWLLEIGHDGLPLSGRSDTQGVPGDTGHDKR
jgi:hypothetical protein